MLIFLIGNCGHFCYSQKSIPVIGFGSIEQACLENGWKVVVVVIVIVVVVVVVIEDGEK